MDFKDFTIDAKIAIAKLETYGLSCLTRPINMLDLPITSTGINIYAEPKNWKERGCLAELDDINRRWSFQLNVLHPYHPNIKGFDVILGFIMLPKCQTSNQLNEEINVKFYTSSFNISSFTFVPFKFIPAIENTYFMNISSFNHKPMIEFDIPINYNIYYLAACLRNDERQYCVQVQTLSIPLTREFSIMYIGGMCGIRELNGFGLNTEAELTDYDLTKDLPTFPKCLPFDMEEFVTVTNHPNRIVDWCLDDEQKLKWKK